MSARAKRDTQKRRLYAAEQAAKIIHEPKGAGKLADIPACQAYVRQVCRSAWARKNAKEIAAPRAVMVVGGNGCNANATRIMLTPSGRTRGVVLHELAHVIETRRNGYVTNAWHGREYAAIYLALVRRFMGRAEYLKLRAEFKARKVKYASGRKKRAGAVVGNPDALRIWREAVNARKAATTSE